MSARLKRKKNNMNSKIPYMKAQDIYIMIGDFSAMIDREN